MIGHCQEVAFVQLSFDGINTFHCGVGTIVQQTQTLLKEWNRQNPDLHFKLYLLSGDYAKTMEEHSEEVLLNNRADCLASGGDLFLIPTSIQNEMFGNPLQWQELCANGANTCAEIINQNTLTIILAHDTAYAQLPLRLEELKREGKIFGSFQVLWIPHATSWSYNGHSLDGTPNWPGRHEWELTASQGASPSTFQIGCISDTMRDVLTAPPFNISEETLFPFLTGIILDKYQETPSEEKVIEELSKYQIPLDKRLIFAIGRANPLKGLDITLEMFRLLRQKNDDIHLVLLAPISDYMPSYQQLLKRRVEEEHLDVTLIDTFDPDIAHYIYQYPKTELVCLLSRMDTKPLTVMESRTNPKNSVILVSNSNRMGDQVVDQVNGFTCSLEGLEEIISEPVSLPHPIQNVVDKAQWILNLPQEKRLEVLEAGKALISGYYDLRSNMEKNLQRLVQRQLIPHLYGWTEAMSSTPISRGLANPPLALYKGASDTPWAILKWVPSAPLTAEDRFSTINELKEGGCNVLPKIHKNREGKYVSWIGSTPFLLMEYLPPSKEELSFTDMLLLTGRLHQHTSEMTPKESLKLSKLDEYIERQSTLLDPWFSLHFPRYFDTPQWKRLRERSSYFASSSFIALYNSLPKTLIHGDNNQTNTLISNDSPYLIDLDAFRYDVRLLDLASYFRYGGYETYARLYNKGALLDTIQSTYETVAPSLTFQEKTLLPLLVEFSEYDFLSWALSELKREPKDLERQAELLQHIKTYQNQLSEDFK